MSITNRAEGRGFGGYPPSHDVDAGGGGCRSRLLARTKAWGNRPLVLSTLRLHLRRRASTGAAYGGSNGWLCSIEEVGEQQTCIDWWKIKKNCHQLSEGTTNSDNRQQLKKNMILLLLSSIKLTSYNTSYLKEGEKGIWGWRRWGGVWSPWCAWWCGPAWHSSCSAWPSSAPPGQNQINNWWVKDQSILICRLTLLNLLEETYSHL